MLLFLGGFAVLAVIGLVITLGVREHLQQLTTRLGTDHVDQEALQRAWHEVRDLASSQDADVLRQGLLQADKLFVMALKEVVYEPGQPLHERDQEVQARLRSYREVWQVHEALSSGRAFNSQQTKAALTHYQAAFRRLGLSLDL